MATKPRRFELDTYYHIYNRGVEKRNLFLTDRDYQRFEDVIAYYLCDQAVPYTTFQDLAPKAKSLYLQLNPKGSETQRGKLLVYCLMPNHFHLLVKPAKPNGITQFVSDISNSHTKYFNLKNERIGRLLQGTFKSKEITSEPSLLQVSRYIHLNPAYPHNYPYSSYQSWLKPESATILDQKELASWLEYAGGPKKYKEFVESKLVKNLALGIEDLVLE